MSTAPISTTTAPPSGTAPANATEQAQTTALATAEQKPEPERRLSSDELDKLLGAETNASDNGAIAPFAGNKAFESAQRIAKALASSNMVPEAYRGLNNIPNVLIAMELASRIGCSIFAAMQNIDIIYGRPSWRSQFLIATVNASGRFTPLRFRWQGKEGTPEFGCRAIAKDKSDGEECVGALITLGLAKAEGWSDRKGTKWLTMSEQMLMYRAAAFWARIYAPELALGMQTADEIEDIVPTNLAPVPGADQANTGRRMSLSRPGAIDVAPIPTQAAPAAEEVKPAEVATAKEQAKPAAKAKAPAEDKGDEPTPEEYAAAEAKANDKPKPRGQQTIVTKAREPGSEG